MAHSPKFNRDLPSPTNIGVPGQVKTPKGTIRNGIPVHKGDLSKGCLTCGSGAKGRAKEKMISRIVENHADSGGTTLHITDLDCCNK